MSSILNFLRSVSSQRFREDEINKKQERTSSRSVKWLSKTRKGGREENRPLKGRPLSHDPSAYSILKYIFFKKIYITFIYHSNLRAQNSGSKNFDTEKWR